MNVSPRRRRVIVAYLITVTFLIAAMLVSALVGAADLNPLDTVAALAGHLPLVHLHDSSKELKEFLQAMYDPR